MVITAEQVEQMVAHARSEYPNEACGLIGSLNGIARRIYPITNADASPVHYHMDSKEQLQAMLDIDDNDWDMGAVYHSHTHTRAYPSPTDVRLAFYPEALYIIISLAGREPDIRAYRIVDGVIEEAPLEIVPETRPSS